LNPSGPTIRSSGQDQGNIIAGAGRDEVESTMNPTATYGIILAIISTGAGL
jgi:hypothetical protein